MTLGGVQGAIRADFGLNIPQGALKTILGRAVRTRLVLTAGDNTYVPDLARLSEGAFAASRARALDQEQALVVRLVDFAYKQFKTRWSDDEAERVLLTYVEERGATVLGATTHDQPVLVIERPSNVAKGVVDAFVIHLNEHDPEGFRCLETFVQGSVLASALYFRDLGRVNHRFDNLSVYLDTRVVLRALGTAGPAAQAASREFLDLVYEVGGTLHCFDHTLNEIRGVLLAAAAALRDRANLRRSGGESLEYLAAAGYRASDVELLAARLNSDLSALRVSVRDRPPHEARYTVDEVQLEQLLRSEVRYTREEALRHDLDALTAVYLLRRGKASIHLESAAAVFVTTNTPLVRASLAYFNNSSRADTIPLCFSDYQFATLAWLKQPLAAPDLPMKFVLADSYAAVNPSPRLWHAYLDELAKLVSRFADR